MFGRAPVRTSSRRRSCSSASRSVPGRHRTRGRDVRRSGRNAPPYAPSPTSDRRWWRPRRRAAPRSSAIRCRCRTSSGREQIQVTAGAGEQTGSVFVEQLAGERPLGASVAQHRILRRGQPLTPLLVGERQRRLRIGGHRAGLGSVGTRGIQRQRPRDERCSDRRRTAGQEPSSRHHHPRPIGSGMQLHPRPMRQGSGALTSPSQDHRGIRSPSGTSSALSWYRDIVVVVAQAK